ncbi:molybdopterin-dependent oxidoreductase [Chenggangzhangella methanolivorans]|uniref:Molybdopterin-dependent oxidoreductase n=1 Tax=Chenggangzhangella methanolivorans TaxID=1437009 RepID=A0A9E6R6J5_9HYPH|nr:molybdopterin-dependent oxidoreductase [Chenggangzhangella methanolivorans]QZN98858.1 molybdopterin-dependent oxidoreductase [Chenggangzhangella methanolivorans]
MTRFRTLAAAVAFAALAFGGTAQAASCDGGFSSSFKLRGEVENPTTFKLKDLKKLPSSRVTVTYFSGSAGLVTQTYTGVSLNDMLAAAVIKLDPTRKNDILRKYVAVRATDCYEAIIAVADLLPNFGAQQVLIAYADGNGQPLSETEGMARLIIAGDKQGGRLVSNVKAVIVGSAED